jgi:hypothetical protein
MKRKIAAFASILAVAVIATAVFVKMNQYKPTYEWTFDPSTKLAFVLAHDEERGLLAGTPKDPNLVTAMFALDPIKRGLRFYPAKQPKICNVVGDEGDRVNVYYGKMDVLRSRSVEGRVFCNTDPSVDSKYKVFYFVGGSNASKLLEGTGANSITVEHQIFSMTGFEAVLENMEAAVKESEQAEKTASVETAPSEPEVAPEPEVVAPEPVQPVVEEHPPVASALPTEPATVIEDDKPFAVTDKWVIVGNKHYVTAANSKGDNPTVLVRTESPLVGIVYTMIRPKDGSKCEKFDSRTEAGWGADGMNFNTVFYSVQCTDKLGPNYETVHVFSDTDADAIEEAVKGAEAAKQNVTVDNVEFPTQSFTLTRNAM